MTYVAIALYLLAMPALHDSARKGGLYGSLLNVTVIFWPLAMVAYLAIKIGKALGFEWATRLPRQ